MPHPGPTMRDTDAQFHVFSLGSADSKPVDQNGRVYKKRKAHSKTTSGCRTCKARKVKCDESTPICARCRRNHWLCTYGPPAEHQNLPYLSRPASHQARPCHISVLSGLTVDPYGSPDIKNGTSSMHLMQHFHAHSTEILHLPHTAPILSLARSQPLVRTTLLALAAAHLRHLVPALPQHRLAEHFHQHLALHAHQDALAVSAAQRCPGGVDAFLLSATLLNILAFALPAGESPVEPGVSWVFSPQPDRLGWLALQAGLWSVLVSTDAFRAQFQTFLIPLFLGVEHTQGVPDSVRGGLEDVPERWIKLFELDDAKRAAIFLAPATLLSRLRSAERTSVFHYLGFPAKLSGGFHALLNARDPRALWLLGYWFGLLRPFGGVWWAGGRAARDYAAILLWLREMQLQERVGMKGELWNEMMKELERAPRGKREARLRQQQ